MKSSEYSSTFTPNSFWCGRQT